MSAEQNKEIVRRAYEEVVNGRNSALALELYNENYLHHDPSLPLEFQTGLSNYMKHFTVFTTAFPDLRVEIHEIIGEGDYVATRWSWHGTQLGELMGIPASGRTVSCTAMSLHRIRNGKVEEGWVNFDAIGMMQQLGVMPAPAEQGA